MNKNWEAGVIRTHRNALAMVAQIAGLEKNRR
ncbi:MAG: hypothetical protein R3F36_01755 [Candidatus Competibacteraceae bacterium]